MRAIHMGTRKPEGDGWDPGLFGVTINMDIVAMLPENERAKFMADEIRLHLEVLLQACKDNDYQIGGTLVWKCQITKP